MLGGEGRAGTGVPVASAAADLPLPACNVPAPPSHRQGDVYAWGLNGDGQLGDGSDMTALQVGPGGDECGLEGGAMHCGQPAT